MLYKGIKIEIKRIGNGFVSFIFIKVKREKKSLAVIRWDLFRNPVSIHCFYKPNSGTIFFNFRMNPLKRDVG